MNAKLISRIVTVLVFGMAVGIGMGLHMEARGRAGRDAFMAEESGRWDRVYAHPHHLAGAIILCVGGALLLCGAYELTSAGLYWVIRKVGPDETKIS